MWRPLTGRLFLVDDVAGRGRLDELPARWRFVTVDFAVAAVLMLGAAAIGRLEPRLGEAIGRRTPHA